MVVFMAVVGFVLLFVLVFVGWCWFCFVGCCLLLVLLLSIVFCCFVVCRFLFLLDIVWCWCFCCPLLLLVIVIVIIVVGYVDGNI